MTEEPDKERHVSFKEETSYPEQDSLPRKRTTAKQKVGFYDIEIARLKAQLRLSGYIVQMTKKPRPPNTPNIWNALTPYTSLYDLDFIHNLPKDQFVDGSTRLTATGVVDAEVDVVMDNRLPKHSVLMRQDALRLRLQNKSVPSQADLRIQKFPPRVAATPQSEKRGSTNLTPFPKINLCRPLIAKKKDKIYYNDVKEMRKQVNILRKERQEKKNKFEHERTSNDFYRMEIDVARDRVGPMNRFLLDQACVTYLGTWKGATIAYKKLANLN